MLSHTAVRTILLLLLLTVALPADSLRERAAAFVKAGMPPGDAEVITAARLERELTLGLDARRDFTWARKVPEDIFFNHVLPYAVLDEARDEWRADFRALSEPLVEGAGTAAEAADRLNRGIFDKLGVRYSREREKPNQSAKESIASGKASCTGLSIILINACRSVGIPARAVGTPLWANGSGNHTWVEIWDGGWHFLGAAEADDQGLNHSWFTDLTARARMPDHGIYASSWKRTGVTFPLVWAPDDQSVPATNVTARYAVDASAPSGPGLRFLSGGKRIAVKGLAIPSMGTIETFRSKGASSDFNDVPTLAKPGTYELRVHHEGNWLSKTVQLPEGKIYDLVIEDFALRALQEGIGREAAEREREILIMERRLTFPFTEAEHVEAAGKTMHYRQKIFGEAPDGGRSLWISLHGGGGAPPQVNDQQWRNQINLYEPEEGIYLAPRAPTNTWNLWHEAHIDALLSKLIEEKVAYENVDPEKVYLLGYSAGGDGVWQLAPRMADRFAAAAMMAGHPNDASLRSLRNLPFGIFMGALDAAYERNAVARKKAEELAQLAEAEPGAYKHMVRIYEGLGHWMERKDAEALPWMKGFARESWPRKILWQQDDVLHQRFYWLQIPEGSVMQAGETLEASIDGQVISIKGTYTGAMSLLLADELLDLDEAVTVKRNGAGDSVIKVTRDTQVPLEALEQRFDPAATPTAILTLPSLAGE